MNRIMDKRRRALLFFLAATAAIFGRAEACDIPVFRYALDNWPADRFTATLFHEGPLDESQRDLLDRIEDYALADQPILNIEIDKLDLASGEERASLLWEKAGAPPTPGLVVSYPGSAMNSGPVSAVPFEATSLKGLLDSPQRRELVSRLQNGQSAVWVFIASGDTEKDAEAIATLESTLGQLEKTLELPSVEDDPNAPADLLDPEGGDGPTLRIEFSILTLERDDPTETLLVNLLLNSEPDLLEPDFASEPMVFPIYGRGRVLYALIGKGINPDVIREACEFLVGPCSCQVKDLNPGSTDLLLTANWGELHGDPMQGLELGIAGAVDGLGSSKQSESFLSGNLAMVLGVQAILVLGVSAFLLMRRRETSLG